jgi:hypothetical protein
MEGFCGREEASRVSEAGSKTEDLGKCGAKLRRRSPQHWACHDDSGRV